MNLRQKLLLLFSLIVAASIAVVAWTVLLRIRRVFEQEDQQKTQLVVSLFQRELGRRSAEVANSLDRLAASDRMRRIAEELAESPDPAPYLTEAQSLAAEAQLDFLEILTPDGNIVSSAQWPARFGYPEPATQGDAALARHDHAPAFIKREELPDNTTALGLFALRTVRGGQPIRILGGKRLDRQFLTDLSAPPGIGAYLYDATQSTSPTAFDPARLQGSDGEISNADRYRPILETAIRAGQPSSSIVYLTSKREESVYATVLPLADGSGGPNHPLAAMVIAVSRRPMVEAQQHIRSIAYSVAAAGIFVAIVVSIWIAARISRPIEELARASEEVAEGNWSAAVEARGRDEIATLARSFNHMTQELASQRERLIQSERVAAWRELARRLAHELKNPLFPLQITIENLLRARRLSPEEFDEVFTESTTALTQELANLKTIIGRFSDFSRMPRPHLERIDAREALRRIASLYFPQRSSENESAPRHSLSSPSIICRLELPDEPLWIDADPELLHRALSNLTLNAIDVMDTDRTDAEVAGATHQRQGILTLSAACIHNHAELRVSDTGQGLTPEECERLFTPYYTTKQHGTGLGLAIVQSVVADHGASIRVDSTPGQGATFTITFNKAAPPQSMPKD
ncbi:MAG TPA: ATP-binding protein [Acidobacteriaceae bacterium]